MKTQLEWFDAYVKIGFQPIAVIKTGKNKSPLGKFWNDDWTVDKWRHRFEVEGQYNMGILLGNIIDVEGDTKESNELLIRLTEGVPHPQFQSSKSIHHLFINPDPDLWRITWEGMEFRAYRHQSVVPPSIHEFGMQYKWLKTGFNGIPNMPQGLLDHYNFCKASREAINAKSRKNKSKLKEELEAIIPGKTKQKPGYTRTECRICKERFYIHKKRISLEVKAFRELGLPWMCHQCREIDVREQCRIIRRVLEQESNLPYVPLRDD